MAGEFSARVSEAAKRGGQWLATRSNDDGSIGAGAGIRTMYKSLAALAASGQPEAAGRLADWLKSTAERRPGVFEHPARDAPQNQNLYTDCWILLGAQRLGRDDIASTDAIQRVADEQHACGGFSMAPAAAGVRLLDPTSTSLAGMTLLAAGCVDQAERAGRFLIDLIDRQPDVEHRFWFLVDPDGGHIVTSSDANQEILFSVDYRRSKQLFFHLGVPAVLLADLAETTAAGHYADAAHRYAQAARRICRAGRSFTCACKCAWGVSRYAGLTKGAAAWQGLAQSLSEAVFLDAQLDDGGWREPTILLSDDGRVSRTLSREEITAEFTYELFAIAEQFAEGAAG